MKTTTFNLLTKTSVQIKHYLFAFTLLFIGFYQAHADCTIPSSMTGSQLVAYINDPLNNCGGEVTIPAGVIITITDDVTIPDTVDKIIIEEGGHIWWTAKAVLILFENTAIKIEDTDSTFGEPIGVSGSQSCNNNVQIRIGDIEYSRCVGGGNNCIIFADLIDAGGTPQLDPDFEINPDLPSGTVCFGPTDIGINLGGLISGTVTYSWEVSPNNTGPGDVTFSNTNTENTTIDVTLPGTYTIRANLSIALGIEGSSCANQSVDVFADFEITFLASVTASTMYVNPSTTGNGTCGLSVDFDGEADNVGTAPTYLWVFGDGNTSDEIDPTHTYTTPGTYTVTFTVTNNDAGTLPACNSATTSQEIIITDSDPEITCPGDFEFSNDTDSCGYTVTNNNLNPTAITEDCAVFSVLNDYNNGTTLNGATFPVGTTTVTWTITDGSNNVDTCSFDVTVNDTQIPLITCPAPINVDADANSCQATNLNIVEPTATDNCATTFTFTGTRSDNLPLSDPYPVGITTITWVANDGTNDSLTCDQIVTITDAQAPVITCPDNVLANTSDDGLGNCSTTVSLGTPITNDNCGIKSVVAQVGGVDINPATFEFDLGETIVTWIVTDNADITASCNQTVTVVDDEYPRFDAPSAITISCEDDPNDLTLTGTITRLNIDNCDTTPLDPQYSDSIAPGSCANESIITRTWSLYDNTGNFHTHTQLITIQDNTVPVITGTLSSFNANGCDANAKPAAETTVAGLESLGLDISDACSNDANLTVTFSDSANGSCPIVITRTYTITDECNNATQVDQIINIESPEITYNNPSDADLQSCDFNNQGEIDTAFTNWVNAQSTAIAEAGGCSPVLTNNSASATVPDKCSGGTATVTWTITDLCETINTITADFNLTKQQDIGHEEPDNKTVEACSFNNSNLLDAQAALDADIAAWVAQEQFDTRVIEGGCSPTITTNYGSQSIDFCTGGTVTITFTVNDDCQGHSHDATYTLIPADDLVISDVQNETVPAGTYSTQKDLDDAFALWLNNFSVSGGCNPSGEFAEQYTAPALCGGSVNIIYNVSDLCQTGQDIATFEVISVNPLTISDVQDLTVNACDFADQAALDSAFANWIAGFNVTGGFNPQATDISALAAPALCEGGNTSVTYNVTDLCESGQDTATFTVTPADALTISDVQDLTVNACDFDDQAALDTAFANWIAGFSVTGGCDPQATDISALTAPVLCEGGNTSVTYNVTDLCESGQDTATFTVTPADALTISDVQNETVSAGTYSTQKDLDDAFALWLNNFSVSGGCNPSGVFAEQYTAPALCGGSVNIIYNVTDLCQTGQDIATFEVISVNPLTISDVQDLTVNACDFDDQAALDTAFANWIAGFSVTGGFNPQATDISALTAPALCEGGNTSVTYNVTDLCESGQDTATFTVTPADALTISDVQDLTVNACDFDDQAALDSAFANWIAGFSVTGGCDPQATDISALTAPALCEGGNTSVTYNVTDLCESGQDTATFTVTPVTPVVFDQQNLPEDLTVECDNVPSASNLTASTSCGTIEVNYNENKMIDGDCPSSYILIRTWTAIDQCNSIITHTQTIKVQDTQAPTASPFDVVLDVSCTNIPDIPSIEFTDNCSVNIIEKFEETNSYDENNLMDYQIVRTWTVTDECNNTAEFTQTINVTLDEVVTQITSQPRCYDDGIVDLNSFLSNTSLNGTWEIVEGDPIATISGNLFNPTTLELSDDFLPEDGGIDYLFKYTTSENGCITVIELSMNINADCVVLPCGENDIEISKAVTPNGDSYNETFDIMGIDLCGFVAEVQIFNRWGALVYESNNYTLGSLDTSGSHGDWNGSAPKGSLGNAEKVPNGTYYYIIVLKNSGLKPFTGPIYLGTK
ncbi:gliding motility-associated C-terminal domain-containing protein [Thalassobellus sediminis]|uniref:T9SS type B sorting domain-containing protein n=1 Tax=Thalassobellus sediminis TaxID=3367753 RepID=UPI0037A35678